MTVDYEDPAGYEPMCDECPADNMDKTSGRPCPFFMKQQPCPVELGISEVVPNGT